MKTKFLITISFLTLVLISTISCKKEASNQNEKYIKKNWKLDQYLVNSVDKTSALVISGYDESYTDNLKYDRSFTDKNGAKVIQNGSFEFENATRLKVSGVGSIEFTNNNTASSSYYDIIKLDDTQLWYSYTNGNEKHEFRLSKR